MFRSTFWRYAFREVTQRKGRSIGIIAGLAVGIALFVALTTLADGYNRLIELPFRQLKMDVTIQRSGSADLFESKNGVRLPPANQPITGVQAERMYSLPELASVGSALLLWNHSSTGFTVICGIDMAGDLTGPAMVQKWVTQGQPLAQGGQVLMEKHFARVNHYKPGQVIDLGGNPFEIVGLVALKAENAVAQANVYMSIEDARELAGLPPDSSNMIFARLKPGVEPQIVREKLAGILPGGIVSAADNIGEMMKGFGRISSRFSQMLSILALFFSAVVCYRLFSGFVYERRQEIGVMKAVGWRNRDISRVFTMEAICLGAVGGLLGLAVGYAGAYLASGFEIPLNVPWNLNPRPVSGSTATAIKSTLPVVFSLKTSVLAVAMSLALSGLTGAMLARKLAGIKPMEAIRRI